MSRRSRQMVALLRFKSGDPPSGWDRFTVRGDLRVALVTVPPSGNMRLWRARSVAHLGSMSGSHRGTRGSSKARASGRRLVHSLRQNPGAGGAIPTCLVPAADRGARTSQALPGVSAHSR